MARAGEGLVVVSSTISLDGYIAGPRHEMDWVFEHGFLPEGDLEVVDALIASTGAILSGRGGFDVAAEAERAETGSAFGGRWSGPEFVLTHRPPDGPVRPGLRFVSGDITAAVATARRAAEGANLLVLGANVVQQCLAADLVDELLLLVLPILLGDGIRLFAATGFGEVVLRTAEVSRLGEAAVLRYRR